MKNAVVPLIALALLTSCSMPELTTYQKTYIGEVEKTPPLFVVEKSVLKDIMGRAQVWVANYSKLPVQQSTEYVVSNLPAKSKQDGFSYSITATPQGESARISVTCSHVPADHERATGWSDSWTSFNAKACALFLQKGTEPAGSLIGPKPSDMNMHLVLD